MLEQDERDGIDARDTLIKNGGGYLKKKKKKKQSTSVIYAPLVSLNEAVLNQLNRGPFVGRETSFASASKLSCLDASPRFLSTDLDRSYLAY